MDPPVYKVAAPKPSCTAHLVVCRMEGQGTAASSLQPPPLPPPHVSKYRQISSAEQRLHEEADVTHWTGTLSLCVSDQKKDFSIHVLRDQRSDDLQRRDTLTPMLPWDASLKYHTLLL